MSASLDSLFASEGVTSGLTSLAEGTDQVFARALRARRLPFVAVIPSASYESAFQSSAARVAYTELLRVSTSTIELPYKNPSEQAFLAAGQYIALNCDVLFAVWNGRPAKGLGGTADVVQFALANNRRMIHINPVARTVIHL